MIEHDVKQGEAAWIALRLGIPTASEFYKIITPLGKLSKSETMRKYAHRLIAEKILGYPLESLEGLEHIERGKELEPLAVKHYEFVRDLETKKIGFVTTDDGEIGVSPDRMVHEYGLVEIKCPAPNTQIGYLVDGFDEKYKPQVQGQLYVTERIWNDCVIFSQVFPTEIIRVERDDAYIDLLAAGLRQFIEIKQEMWDTLRAKGFFEEHDRVRTIREAEADKHNYQAVWGG